MNPSALFIIAICVNIGMWLERYVIVVVSLSRDFLPSSWGMYTPTFWEFATLAGSFGLFFTMFCLFARFLPVVATAEVKTVLPQAAVHPPADAQVDRGWVPEPTVGAVS